MIRKPTRPQKTRRGHPSADTPPAIDKIRHAAILLFSRQGYEGTSIAEIATTAGVAKPLIHYHFSSKEELWYSAIDQAFGAMMTELETMRTVALGLPPDQIIAMVAVSSVRFTQRYSHLVSIVDDEARSTGPRSDYLLKVFQVPSLKAAGAIIDILNNTLRSGKTPVPAEHLVPILMGATTFPFVNPRAIKTTFGANVRDDVYAQRHAELLAGLLHSVFTA